MSGMSGLQIYTPDAGEMDAGHVVLGVVGGRIIKILTPREARKLAQELLKQADQAESEVQ